MPENKNIEIELDDKTSLRIANLTKNIQSIDSQNKFMMGIHMFLIIFCLTLLFSFWQIESPAASIITIAVLIAGLIDSISFKILTKRNIKIKNEIEKELKNILDKAIKEKGKLLDKII